MARWRETMRTLEHLGGFETVERSLIVDAEGGEPVEVARMSASGFRLAGVVAAADRLPLMTHGSRLVEMDAGGAAAPDRDRPGGRRRTGTGRFRDLIIATMAAISWTRSPAFSWIGSMAATC